MFVDLTTSVNSEDINHFGFAVHGEQDSPAAHTRLSNAGPVGELRRQSRIEWINSKLHKASADTLFTRPVKAIEKLLGFMSRRLKNSQSAFALVVGERLHTASGKICETTIQRGELFGLERRPLLIGSIAEILEPPAREFRLIFRQLIHELV